MCWESGPRGVLSKDPENAADNAEAHLKDVVKLSVHVSIFAASRQRLGLALSAAPARCRDCQIHRLSDSPYIGPTVFTSQLGVCGGVFAEAIGNVITASGFRASFGDDFGVTIVDGPMAGILARAVVVIGADGNAAYTELVPAIDAEPNNDAGLDALGASV